MATEKKIYIIWILSIICCAFISSSSAFDSWEDYRNSWLNEEEYADRLFPFGELYFDSYFDYAPSQNAELDFEFPFYGRMYRHAQIAAAGHILFTKEFVQLSDRTKYPNSEYPTEADPPFISPYLSLIDQTFDHAGKIFWRRLDPGEHEEGSVKEEITRKVLEWISEDVRENFFKTHFEATHGLVVTWHDVTFYACLAGNQCPKNTYQAVLLTDGLMTFVIYNFYELSWAGNGLQGCDSDTGLPEEGPCFTAQVGFNAGEARGFYALPLSNTDEVVKLDGLSGTAVDGRFIHMVSRERVVRGGCTNDEDDALGGIDRWLEITPHHGSLLGGHPLLLAGPCITPSNAHLYRCRFLSPQPQESEVSSAHELEGAGRCIVPRLEMVGAIRVELVKAGEETKMDGAKWHATYTVVPPDVVTPHVTLNNVDDWLRPDPHELSLKWDPEHVLPHNRTLTPTATNYSVDIHLVAYREFESQHGRDGHELEREWLDVATLGRDVINTGTFAFLVDDHTCPGGIDCDWGVPPPVGFITVTPHHHDDDQTAKRHHKEVKIWSDPIPITWYEKRPIEEDEDDDWREWLDRKCRKYHEYEKEKGWDALEHVAACPLTYTQAATEIGRFIVDAECNLTHPVRPCPKLNGLPEVTPHVTCLPEIAPSADGWRARCCYDAGGHLLYSQDHADGSAPDRVDPSGQLPYNQPEHLPTLSHWVWDKLFTMLCCKWNPDPDHCVKYKGGTRPTTDISEYGTPKIAFAYGDPHYRTFDGLEYMFNGRGEFWLLRVRDFGDQNDVKLQARLEQPPDQEWGDIHATVISAVAMQEGGYFEGGLPRVELRVNFLDDLMDNNILVYVDGELQDFSHPDMMKQVFTDKEKRRRLYIINNSHIEQNDQSNFTVIFQNRVTVQVSNRKGTLHCAVHVPHHYFAKTAGLLGVWNGDPDKSLQNPGGVIIDPSSPNEVIHTSFGLSWQIARDDSLFTYRAGLDWEYYRQHDFVPYYNEPVHPIWPPEGSEVTEEMVTETCGLDRKPCRFDYKTTLLREVGEVSIDMEAWSREMSAMAAEIAACGRINVPHAYFESTHYLSGGSMTFTGCETGYTLQGHTTYYCQEEGADAAWSPPPSIECRSNDDINKENSALAAAIAVPVCVVALAGVAAGGFFYYRRKKRQNAGQEEPRTEVNTDGGDTGLSPEDFVKQTPNLTPERTHSTFIPGGDDKPGGEGDPSSLTTGAPRGSTQSLGQTNPGLQRASFSGSRHSVGSQMSMTGVGDLGLAPPEHGSQNNLQFVQQPFEYQNVSYTP